MKSRCYAPSCKDKGHYQKNNIQVCDRWKNSFENFLADMGECPFEDASIERIDNLGDYCPENCKWIHMREQPKNRSMSRFYTIDGRTMCLKDWAREYGINYSTLIRRLQSGMPIRQALTAPLKELKECNHKPVIQMTLQGEVIAEYPSATEASRQVGCGNSEIGKCCQGKMKTSGGFRWKFK